MKKSYKNKKSNNFSQSNESQKVSPFASFHNFIKYQENMKNGEQALDSSIARTKQKAKDNNIISSFIAKKTLDDSSFSQHDKNHCEDYSGDLGIEGIAIPPPPSPCIIIPRPSTYAVLCNDSFRQKSPNPSSALIHDIKSQIPCPLSSIIVLKPKDAVFNLDLEYIQDNYGVIDRTATFLRPHYEFE